MVDSKSDMVFLGIGDSAGCYGHGGILVTVPLEGGGSASWGRYRSSIPDNRLECYYWRLVDGGTVMDKRPAFALDDKASVGEALRGPMLDPWLESGHIDKLSGARAMEPGEVPGCLDSVALDVYLARWRPLGARVGKRDGDAIAWEDGEREAITIPAWELARN